MLRPTKTTYFKFMKSDTRLHFN